MARMVMITCKCGCGRQKEVRLSDVKRGWGLYFSKSCKAKDQEKNTGQFRAYLEGRGVSHNAKRKGKDPKKAVFDYCKKNNIPINKNYDSENYGYGHIFVSGDEGHGQE